MDCTDGDCNLPVAPGSIFRGSCPSQTRDIVQNEKIQRFSSGPIDSGIGPSMESCTSVSLDINRLTLQSGVKQEVPTPTETKTKQEEPQRSMDSGVQQCINCAKVKEEPMEQNSVGSTYDSLSTLNMRRTEAFAQDVDGDTDLHISIVHHQANVALAIMDLALGPDSINIQNARHQSALHLATLTNQPNLVRKLVTRGAQLDMRDRNGNTSLHLACREGFHACVEALLKPVQTSEMKDGIYALPFQRVPQHPELKNYRGETCLHVAAAHGQLHVLSVLLSHTFGADINARDTQSGRTVLHRAVEADVTLEDQYFELLERLLCCRDIDLHAHTYDGHTAMTLARGRGLVRVEQLLQNTCTDRNIPVEDFSGQLDDDDDNNDAQDDEMESVKDEPTSPPYDDFEINGHRIQPTSSLSFV